MRRDRAREGRKERGGDKRGEEISEEKRCQNDERTLDYSALLNATLHTPHSVTREEKTKI